MVTVLSHLWRWVTEQEGPLHERPRGQVERGGGPTLPRHGPEALWRQAVQPHALC